MYGKEKILIFACLQYWHTALVFYYLQLLKKKKDLNLVYELDFF